MPPPPQCRCTSKRTAATTKIALLPSYRLCRKACGRYHAAAAATSAATLPPPSYHCLQNIKKFILLTNLFFTMMVTAACRDNGRNQLTCIEKGKPKKNNKIRQHEKNKPIFQFLLSIFLVQPPFCSNSHHCDCHCHPSQPPPATHAASPLLPPFPPPPQQRNNQ